MFRVNAQLNGDEHIILDRYALFLHKNYWFLSTSPFYLMSPASYNSYIAHHYHREVSDVIARTWRVSSKAVFVHPSLDQPPSASKARKSQNTQILSSCCCKHNSNILILLIMWLSTCIWPDMLSCGMPGTFSPSPRVSDSGMHYGTCRDAGWDR